MGAHGAGDQAQAADQQHQHDQRMKERGGLEVNMHVGDYAGQNEERAGNSEQPSDGAASIEEQNSYTEQQRNERNAEAIGAPETPVGAHDRHLVGNEISADAHHDKADEEFTQSARGAAYIG